MRISLFAPLQTIAQTKAYQSYRSWYNRLSTREQYIVWIAFLITVTLVTSELVIKPVKQKFNKQSEQLAKLEQDFKAVPFILDRYRKFYKKKSDIESEFQLVEIKEGEQTLLENILSGKVDPGFDINPGVVRAFGGNYEQASFNVRFTITSLASLVELLTEISTGSKRMLLTSLAINRESSGERLRVELSVSSIRRNTQ